MPASPARPSATPPERVAAGPLVLRRVAGGRAMGAGMLGLSAAAGIGPS